MTIEGVDVSRHQSPERCDWATAAAAGLAFVWVKGSEGKGGSGAYVDPAAEAHIGRIRQTSLTVGMYHFARPDNRFAQSADGYANGQAEGEFAVETAKALGVAGEDCLPIALDLEKYAPSSTTTAQRVDFVRGMVDAVERDVGRLPAIYTGANYWRYQQSPELAAELNERGVRLWLVNYTDKQEPTRTIPGWDWTVWQWSGGSEFAFADPWPGLPHPIDRNRFRGKLEGLPQLDWDREAWPIEP